MHRFNRLTKMIPSTIAPPLNPPIGAENMIRSSNRFHNFTFSKSLNCFACNGCTFGHRCTCIPARVTSFSYVDSSVRNTARVVYLNPMMAPPDD